MKKKYKKLIIILSIIIVGLVLLALIIPLFSDSSALKDSYNKSKVNKSVTGYSLDLRIYGSYKKNYINKSIRITNYKNTDILIENLTDNEKYARVDNKVYKYVKDKYEEVPIYNKYQDPNIFMDGIENSKKVDFKEDKEVAGTKYKVFSLVYKKDYVNKVLKDLDIKIPNVDKDIPGDVWLDSDNRVYKVYYYIDKVTIYASYFGYNSTNKLDLFGTKA